MVPNGWEVKKLEDLCAPDAPITYGVLKPGEYCSNGIPLLQIKDLSNGQVSSQDLHLISKELDEEYKRSRILKNDILISLVGTIGRVAKFELSTPANIHRNLGRIRTDYHEFIFHFLNSDVALKLMGDSSSGSSQSALNLSTLRAMKVPFPPFKEQQKIAQILSTWDQLILATEKLLKNSQQQKKALMQQLLTGKKRLLDENGVAFDNEWVSGALKNFIKQFIVPMRDKPTDLCGSIPWCRIEDFDGKYLSVSKSNQGVSEETINNMNLKVFPKGTLLVSCSADLGRCAIVIKPLVTNQTFIGLVPNEKLVSVEFLYYLMGSIAHKLNALSSGTTISYLSRNEFEKFNIYLPEISEQEKIAKVLSLADQEIETLQKKLDCLKQEKKALMQQLLTGKKRVKVAA